MQSISYKVRQVKLLADKVGLKMNQVHLRLGWLKKDDGFQTKVDSSIQDVKFIQKEGILHGILTI